MFTQGVTAIHYATWLMTFVSRENRKEQAYTLHTIKSFSSFHLKHFCFNGFILSALLYVQDINFYSYNRSTLQNSWKNVVYLTSTTLDTTNSRQIFIITVTELNAP